MDQREENAEITRVEPAEWLTFHPLGIAQPKRLFVPFSPAFGGGKSGTTFVLLTPKSSQKHETKADAKFT
ncbi:MAG TPA: hypothetical protein VGL17_01515 [Gemmatimonadaceae bacterium]|jgi:hypothetical protein